MDRQPLVLTQEYWPLKEPFVIARGRVDGVSVVTVKLWDGFVTGSGTCRPYARYGETVASIQQQISEAARQLPRGISPAALQNLLPAGAARNALDLAIWDLAAQQAGVSLATVLNIPTPQPVRTNDTTISLGTPGAMADATTAAVQKYGATLQLKVKLGGTEKDASLEAARLCAVRAAAPAAALIVDANEGWTAAILLELQSTINDVKPLLLEQPLPADDDEALRDLKLSCPIFADESVHDRSSLAALTGKYQGINIKLDKTGGMTEALLLKQEARAAGYQIMVGCMVAPAAAIIPAVLLAQDADFADLDGASFLTRDTQPSLIYHNGFVSLPTT